MRCVFFQYVDVILMRFLFGCLCYSFLFTYILDILRTCVNIADISSINHLSTHFVLFFFICIPPPVYTHSKNSLPSPHPVAKKLHVSFDFHTVLIFCCFLLLLDTPHSHIYVNSNINNKTHNLIQ